MNSRRRRLGKARRHWNRVGREMVNLVRHRFGLPKHTDVHQERADREGISRYEAKTRNLREWYS